MPSALWPAHHFERIYYGLRYTRELVFLTYIRSLIAYASVHPATLGVSTCQVDLQILLSSLDTFVHEDASVLHYGGLELFV
jgi:hypothetical protein